MGEMGIEPFNISAALVCVCAQRLLRRVCKNCKVKYKPEGREADIIMKALALTEPPEIFKAAPGGCHVCGGNGYKGRVGIHELMVNCEEIVEAINAEVEVADLKRVCMKMGMKTMHQDSMLKVKFGLTTMEDALSNVPADMIAEEGPDGVVKKKTAHAAHYPIPARTPPRADKQGGRDPQGSRLLFAGRV